VNEACANIHRHAYAGREDGSIEFQVEVTEAAIRLRIRDYGSAFREEAYRKPDLDHPREGGYGVYLIHELMDEVEYIRREAGTELRMLKIRHGGRPGRRGDAHVREA
jgi:serine/threonine-protein kinase RsbW